MGDRDNYDSYRDQGRYETSRRDRDDGRDRGRDRGPDRGQTPDWGRDQTRSFSHADDPSAGRRGEQSYGRPGQYGRQGYGETSDLYGRGGGRPDDRQGYDDAERGYSGQGGVKFSW